MLSSVLTDFAICWSFIMDEITNWITSEKAIQKSKKGYAHFDQRTDISKCKSYITTPQNIASHGFYPFIHYEKSMIKYHKNKGKKIKIRDICYAAHIDRCIYQLYSHILNELYNDEIEKRGISSVSVAYRTDLSASNIQTAKRAFDFIKCSSPCYIMIGDFTGFFDNLNHNYLKTQWCNLLGVDHLPKDHYAVFKNITKYSKWELDDIYEINGLENNASGWKQLNSLNRVLTRKQFHENRSQIIKNPNPFGIPQGSPISAMLANLYMIDIDTIIYEIVNNLGGMYMRYSDDFIIILPKLHHNISLEVINRINDIFNSIEGLKLEPNKTQYYTYSNHMIENCGNLFIPNNENAKKTIDFLGFSFDGLKITIRPKTISKYYYRMYSKAKTITRNKGFTRNGKKISKENLYNRYSIRGAYCKKGNFLSYVERSKLCFGNDEKIDKSTKNHMQKISKALKYK